MNYTPRWLARFLFGFQDPVRALSLRTVVYWGTWSDYVISRTHILVLEHIARISEARDAGDLAVKIRSECGFRQRN